MVVSLVYICLFMKCGALALSITIVYGEYIRQVSWRFYHEHISQEQERKEKGKKHQVEGWWRPLDVFSSDNNIKSSMVVYYKRIQIGYMSNDFQGIESGKLRKPSVGKRSSSGSRL